jgi:hypothetical protein
MAKLVLTLVAMLAGPCLAAEAPPMQFMGRHLAEACSDGYAYYNYGRCAGYILGVHDALVGAGETGICAPATGGAVSEVLVEPMTLYLGSDGARLDRPAAEIVADVLRARFPCERGALTSPPTLPR